MYTTQYIYICRYPKHIDKLLKIGTTTDENRPNNVNRTFLPDKPILHKLYRLDINEAKFLEKYSRSRAIDDFFKNLLEPYNYKGDGGKEFYKIDIEKAEELVARYSKLFGGEEVPLNEVRLKADGNKGLEIKTIYDGVTLPDVFYFKTPKAKNAYGEMRLEDGHFRVTKADFREISSSITAMKPEQVEDLREQFLAKGFVEFDFPSPAATFIYGGNVRGTTAWKNKDGVSLIDVIKAQR